MPATHLPCHGKHRGVCLALCRDSRSVPWSPANPVALLSLLGHPKKPRAAMSQYYQY